MIKIHSYKGGENMQINKELTIKFYEKYNPCNCGGCSYFIKHIESEHPEICDYLKSMNVDPLKPLELISIYHEKEKKIEYVDCMYIVIGNLEEEFEKEINQIKITTCKKERYSLLDINDEYFLISFGPIFMNYADVYNRHLTFKDKVQMIKQAIDEVDPIGLLAMNCPIDEYLQEATIIAKETTIKKANYVKGRYIQEVFKRQFDEKISLKESNAIAQKINFYLDMKDYFKDFEENEILKDKVSINDNTITLKIHDNFIIRNKGNKTYINDKFYDDIEDQDLLDSLCEFVEDKDTIYIQYAHWHFGFHFNHSGYFKEIKRSKYSYEKLRHKNDIELIFNNERVINLKKISNLSNETIIEQMFNEPVDEQCEKLFYSPDKKKRLIVIKNRFGSYSYYTEKLTILDEEEIRCCGQNAIWEPQYGYGGISFYENIDDLLKDIKVEIQGWIGKNHN